MVTTGVFSTSPALVNSKGATARPNSHEEGIQAKIRPARLIALVYRLLIYLQSFNIVVGIVKTSRIAQPRIGPWPIAAGFGKPLGSPPSSLATTHTSFQSDGMIFH